MPYSIELPDGRIVADIPDEVDPRVAKARIDKAFPELTKTKPVDEPAAGSRSMLQYAKDLGLSFQTGFTQDVRSRGAAFGTTGTEFDKFAKDATEHLEGLKSAVAQKNQQEIARIMDSAKDKGIFDQVVAGAKAFGVDPGMMLASTAGSLPTSIAATLFGKPISAAVGAFQGAGIVKTAMYDAVKEELSKTNLPPGEIEKRALEAQDYFGKNPGMIATGALLGAITSITGIEKTTAKMLANRVAREVAESEAEAVAKQGITKTVAKGVAGELPLEFAQGAQEQLASNIALQGAGVDTPTMRGVVSQGTLEGIAGGVMGGGFSLAQRAQAKNKLAQRDAAALTQEELAAAPPPDSLEAKVTALATQLEARGMDSEAAMMTAAQLVQEQEAARVAEEEKAAAKVATTEEAPGATSTIADTAGASVEVPSGGSDTAVPAGGVAAPVTTGLDVAGAAVEQPNVGAAVQPDALGQTVADIQPPPVDAATQTTAVEPTPAALAPGPATLNELGGSTPVTIRSVSGNSADISIKDEMGEVLRSVPVTSLQQEPTQPAPATTEEPSVAETTETKQAEEKGTEAAQVPDTPVDADTKAATDELSQATTAVDTATKAREESKATRGKGKAEPAALRRAQRDADDMLETAITGANGMLNTLDKVQQRIAGAEKVLLTQVTRARTQPNVPDTAKVEIDAEMQPIEDALLQNRADRDIGLTNLFEFASNPKYEGRPSHTAAVEYLRKLDEPTKDRIVQRSKRRLEAEAGLKGRKSPVTFEQTLEKQREERAINRAEKKMDEEALARAEGTSKEVEKPAAQVTTKKKRSIEIPPRVSAQRKRSIRKGQEASFETDENLEMFSSTGKEDKQSVTKALKYIQAIGNEFETALATRLLAQDNYASLRNTEFYVINPKDVAVVNERVAGGFGSALGLYVMQSNTDSIFVRGAGFGEDNGSNNKTVLHEALHATVNKRILYARAAREFGMPITPRLEESVVLLEDVFARTQTALDTYIAKLNDEGKPVPLAIEELIAGDAFSDVTEFVTYGMTDPDMQAFLRTQVSGTVTRTNGMSDFVNTILRLLGLDEKHVSGLRDLIEYTDRIAASMEVTIPMADKAMDYLEAAEALSDVRTIHKSSKKKESEAARIQERLTRLEQSDKASELVNTLGDLSKVAKNPKLWSAYLSVQFKDMNVGGLNALLAVLPTNVVTEMGVKNGIVSLEDVATNIRKMTTMRTKALLNVQEISSPWIKLPAAMQAKLSKVLLYATNARIDPDKTKGADPVLDTMWRQLDPDAKAIYRRVRDFYADNYALYRSLLNKAVDDSGAEGTVDDINTPKGRLAAAIKATYEVGANIEPYFPLMRFGDYWVSFGKGENREYYMFESAGLRDVFVQERMKEIGEKRSFDEMVADLDADVGNNQRTLQERLGNDSPPLQNILALIDKLDGTDPASKESLKDQVYKMHLLMLPEASIRKQFLPRKGTAGYSTDALRTFIASGTRLANQLSRVRYGAPINNALSGARESLKGNPDKAKLGAIVKEIELRATDELNPPESDTFLDMMARVSNKLGFVWLLTSAKSALNQMFSVANFSLPVLGTRHGWGKTLKEFSKYMALGYGQIGMYDKDGNWHPPSIGLSARVQSNKEEKAAYRVMQEMGISNMTQTYDLALRRGVPTANYNETWNKAVGYMGALFHHSERLSREITFMTSFRLSFDQTKNFDKAIEQAVADTNEALFDYSSWNKPRAMRPAPVRAVAQFKQFPMFVTLYLWRNFRKMSSFNSTAKERSEGAQMLLGTLGMTSLMAGMSGLPYVIESTILAAVQGLLNADRDDDEEEPIEEKDFKLWFYNTWLPDTFGESKIMGMKLSELITSGALNTATGYDIASGVSLNNMWFHDSPDATNMKAAFDNTLVGMMGPGASVVRNMFAGVEDINNGDTLKGIEKFLPAFFRGGATSLRYSTEGALTSNKAAIKEADEFTATQLVMQTLGFRTTGLAQVMNNNFAIQQMVKKIKDERSDLLKQLDNAIESGSDERIDAVQDKMDAFSDEYPAYVITAQEINKSLKARAKVRSQTERGLYLDKKSRGLDALRTRSLQTMEEETTK
jgi:rRNA processing protein Krr1/Pno1